MTVTLKLTVRGQILLRPILNTLGTIRLKKIAKFFKVLIQILQGFSCERNSGAAMNSVQWHAHTLAHAHTRHIYFSRVIIARLKVDKSQIAHEKPYLYFFS